MQGWRARIGLIYPADGIIDDEYWKFVPDGVAIHITRISVSPEDNFVTTVHKLAETKEVEQAALILATIRPDVIAYACTSSSFVKGIGFDREIIKRIEKATNISATTTSTAIIDALRKLEIKNIGVLTPYVDEINVKLKRFLEDSGFRVMRLIGLQLRSGLDIGNVSPWRIYRLAKELDTPEIDGILISCTGFRTAEIIDPLEQDTSKPVVSANQATIWESLRIANIKVSIKGYGQLWR